MPVSPGTVFKRLVKRGALPNDCWIWQGSLNQWGYGRKQVNGRPVLARRWLWEQIDGPLAPGLELISSCKVNACVNPHHLRPGMPADKARSSDSTILTADEAKAIYELRGACGTHTKRRKALAEQLAEAHGVKIHTIWDIWGKRTWAKKKRSTVAGRLSTLEMKPCSNGGTSSASSQD